MHITNQQRSDFEAHGVLFCQGLVPLDCLAPVRALVADSLQRAEVMRGGTWCAGRHAITSPDSLMSPIGKRLKHRLKQGRALADLLPGEIVATAESLANGETLATATDQPQLLFTPPDATTWTIPRNIWHLDVPRLDNLGCPGVQVFGFLEPVQPGGGGTLVAAGSHRYLNNQGRIRSRDVKKRIRREDPWFAELLTGIEADRQHLMDGSRHPDGLHVVEMTGQPGDVWFTDMRVLHTLAPNASDTPRLMFTQRYYRPEAARLAYSPDVS